ncbi:hypothetical protein Btru_028606 [Bulinus truncatus]|nr:hypothetical protein Btru_028606 [Bulinus truncatus]
MWGKLRDGQVSGILAARDHQCPQFRYQQTQTRFNLVQSKIDFTRLHQHQFQGGVSLPSNRVGLVQGGVSLPPNRVGFSPSFVHFLIQNILEILEGENSRQECFIIGLYRLVKLENEREKLQRPESESSDNGYEGQLKLQQAMLRRQELLDKIRQEQLSDDKRPRTYTPRRRYTPSLLPPPSRRSLPDINTKQYHFGFSNNNHSDMAQVKHVIEHQFKQAPQASYSLPPIQTQPIQQVAAVQPITYMSQPMAQEIVPIPAVHQTLAYPALTVRSNDRKDTMFNKSDFMDMMMLQNAQMHHMVMQQMMLHQLPGARPATIPFAEPAAPVALMRPAPSIYHHHINSQPNFMPPMDYRGMGGNGGYYGRNFNSTIYDDGSNYYHYH